MRLEQGITGKAMAEQLEVSGGAYSTKELHPEVLSFTVEDLIRIAYLFNNCIRILSPHLRWGTRWSRSFA